ncbi:MAG: hypothetical protein ACI9A7_000043 [Cyclobacteriaceae bacterium]|jgi:hypothetical protein
MKIRNFVLVLLIVIWGCNEIEQCQLEPNREGFTLGFFKSSDSTAYDSTGFTFITPGVTSDSIQSILPLDPLDTTITYIFGTDSTDYNLVLSYDVIYYLFSPDCDPSIRFFDLKVLSTNFDSVAVISDIVDEQIPTNFEIYL